jgi:RNA polymerase sigma factor for flagellar operon FliA
MVMQTQAVDVLGEFLLTRSPELREKLVLQSVPLVHYMLGRMGITQEMGSEYEDLAHQGLMGLIEAVDRFDPDFRARFSSYASIRIRGKILDYMRTSDWMPRTARKRAHSIQKTVNNFWSENQRAPTDEEIATHLGTTVEDVRQGWADSHRVLISLDEMIETDLQSEVSRHEALPHEDQIDPSEALEEECLIQEMADAIQNLSEREKLILSLYYNDELTFKEIGEVLDITESRVSQLHTRAILNLKEMMNHEQ